MKAGTTENMKFLVMKRLLGVHKYQLIGILEGLWILTANSANDGAIGKFSDMEIAAWLEWQGDSEELIESLVVAGFLDRCQENRLVVHDWAEHCPAYVKGNMGKHKKSFAVVKQPPKDVAKDVTKESPNETAKDHPYGYATKSSQVKPSQVKSSQVTTTAPPVVRGAPPEDFLLAWSKYPARAGGNPRQRALKAWRARITEGVSPEEILDGLERYRRYCEISGKIGTSYVMQAATFFGPDRRWLEDWGQPVTQNRMDAEAKAAISAAMGDESGPSTANRVFNGEVVK